MSPLPEGDQASRMLSEPAKTVTPAATSRFTGGIGTGPGPSAVISMPAFASASACTAKLRIADAAEREGVADRDFAAEPGEFRPPRDLPDLRTAERPKIVDMDIDADAALLRDAEDRVELPLHVVVDAGRIKPPDEVGAFLD